MAPHSLDSLLNMEEYTQESYEEAVRKMCEPSPPRGKDDDDLDAFIDSTMASASKSLEIAASVFALGGLAFPQVALVGVAVGIGATVVKLFDSQNKMKALLDKLTQKIQEVRRQMNSGFNNLEENITGTDFLSEVVSPANELFAAYIRYVSDPNSANKQEFIECCETRRSGGIRIITAMLVKIDANTEANFIMKSQIARHYVHKEYVDSVMYLYKSLLDVIIAHTFYYTMMSADKREQQMKEDKVVNLMKEVEGKLQGVADWRKKSYFTKGNLEPVISDITKKINNYGNHPEGVINWLEKAYPWKDFKDKFVAISWTEHESRLYEAHISDNKEQSITFIKLKTLNNRYTTMFLQRMPESSILTDNEKSDKKKEADRIMAKVRNRDIENVWDSIGKPPVTGFTLVLFHAVANFAPEHAEWDCKYAHSKDSANDYYVSEFKVEGGLFTNKRDYHIFFQYAKFIH